MQPHYTSLLISPSRRCKCISLVELYCFNVIIKVKDVLQLFLLALLFYTTTIWHFNMCRFFYIH